VLIEQIVNGAALTVLNRMLAREGWARERLAPFAGRVARFEAPPFAFAFRIADDGSFADAERAEPTVIVGADLAALPLALGDPQAALRNVSLRGDAEFAQAVGFVLQNLRPEPEEELSRFIGDAAAQHLVALLRNSASHWRQLAERMMDSGAHYFVTENPMIVGRDEAAEFSAEVARLRDDIARLEKRVERSERSIA
jgi:ubiquinone biosynthesis protein UbiJ